jgi:hypothetical protein
MKRFSTILSALAIPLVFTSFPAFADEAHWSASIGNGHTSSSDVPKTANAGAPASPHWTARIGTGRPTEGGEAARDAGERLSKVAGGHWTSKVGTARASEASDSIAARATKISRWTR